MPLFRRRRPAVGEPPAAVDFWSWWPGVREAVAQSLDDGGPPAHERQLAAHVAALHPDLTHAFVPGRFARHGLVVTGGRRADLRPLTERWRRAGPADDELWELHPAGPPAPELFDQSIEVGRTRVDLSVTAVEARVDDRRCRVDVGVYNPAFATLPEVAREELALLTLTWALGEDDAERWVGAVLPVDHRPLDSVPARMLGAITSQLAQRWRGERWALLEGTHGERRLVATVRQPLHRVDHPLFDEHVAVRLPYDDLTLDGLPGETAGGDLQAFEEALVAQLGESAILAASETSSGERVLHLYGDSTASVVPAVRALLGGYLGPAASVEGAHDPAWRSVEHLRP